MCESEREELQWIEGCKRGDSIAQRHVFETLFPYLKGAVRRYIYDEMKFKTSCKRPSSAFLNTSISLTRIAVE